MATKNTKKAPAPAPKRTKNFLRPQLQAMGVTPAQVAQARKALQVATVPAGYIAVTATLNPACKAAGVSVMGQMVPAIGGDRNILPAVHPICNVVIVGRTRYVHGWLASKAGLAALLSYKPGQPLNMALWGKAPVQPPTA